VSEETQNNLARRRLLRRAGTVAAGVVGAGAVGAVVSAPAQAAPGDAVVEGDNTAFAPTTFSGNDAAPLLTVENIGGPSLRLAPGNALAGSEPQGSFSMDDGGTIFTIQAPGYVDLVQTTWNTSQLVPIVPQRVLNTRTAEGRQYILNPSGNLDSGGRLKAGATIHLRLDYFVINAVAMHANVTAATAAANGYLTIFPFGEARPGTSTLNYPASSILGSLANGFTVGHGWNGTIEGDAISIYNYGGPAHVLLDVTAFTLAWGAAAIDPAILPGGGASAKGSRSAAGKPSRAPKGAWER